MMISSSDCFFLVSMVVSLPFFLGSALAMASTKNIDTICHDPIVVNRAFCLQTLTSYPPAVSATDMKILAKIVIGLGVSHAEKTKGFIAELAKDPTFKTQFKLCNDSYAEIVQKLNFAIKELDEDAMSANYDVMICFDQIHNVEDLISKKTDKASKKLMEMTSLMSKFIEIAAGATDSL